MTIRELIPDWFKDGWCKLLMTERDTCGGKYYSDVNWLDLTIGQVLFTCFVVIVIVGIVVDIMDDNKQKK